MNNLIDSPAENEVSTEQSEALRTALERAEKAEAKLAEVQQSQAGQVQQPAAIERTYEPVSDAEEAPRPSISHDAALTELRKDSMMVHLLDSLDAGKDIGHYGRLVFAMIARHFLSDDEVLSLLTKDPDFSPEQARLMLRQVEGRDYNPPKRDRIMDWHGQQDFPILPDINDPNCGNVYRNLKFPEKVYEHIGHYQEQQAEAGS